MWSSRLHFLGMVFGRETASTLPQVALSAERFIGDVDAVNGDLITVKDKHSVSQPGR